MSVSQNTQPTVNTRDLVSSALRDYLPAIRTTFILSLAINLLMLASPLFMLQVYDRVLASRSLPTLVVLTGLVAGAFLFAAFLETIRQRLMARIGAGVARKLGPAAYAATLDRAVTLNNANDADQPIRDLDTVRHYLSGPSTSAFLDLPWLPIYAAFAFILHPLVGIMTVSAAVLLFVLAYSNERTTRALGVESAIHRQRAHQVAESATRGVEVLRSMKIETRFQDRWRAERETAQQHHLRLTDRVAAHGAFSRMLRLFLQSAVLALAAALAIGGEMSAGSIIAASVIMSRALAPVEQITAQWEAFQVVRRAFARLRLDLSTVAPAESKVELPKSRGALDVEDLVVGAPQAKKPLLTNIRFSIEPGDGLGLIGMSGSGKSALMRTLAGVWPALRGEVRLDGAALDQWPAEQLGRAVGYVPQDVQLFGGTVSDNISRFAAEVDSDAVVRAAQRAGVHDMILRLPDGYQTDIGEAGVFLSAGQRQRIALARAFYSEPSLLLLDEPNSNLDGPGEAALIETLLKARKDGVTVVIVSHRPATLQVTNKVLCLQDGKQAAFGLRDEILNVVRSNTPRIRDLRAATND
ncbi:MAG: type I secretion system permease/ATPase [Hyphomicrobium sp.]|nr:type I secretion system permease/ATPase [Hyphomicrobium sp.]